MIAKIATLTINDRCLQAAIDHKPAFSTMDILFALNKQTNQPMVGLRQVQHALEHLSQRGHFMRLAAGRYAWKY